MSSVWEGECLKEISREDEAVEKDEGEDGMREEVRREGFLPDADVRIGDDPESAGAEEKCPGECGGDIECDGGEEKGKEDSGSHKNARRALSQDDRKRPYVCLPVTLDVLEILKRQAYRIGEGEKRRDLPWEMFERACFVGEDISGKKYGKRCQCADERGDDREALEAKRRGVVRESYSVVEDYEECGEGMRHSGEEDGSEEKGKSQPSVVYFGKYFGNKRPSGIGDAINIAVEEVVGYNACKPCEHGRNNEEEK